MSQQTEERGSPPRPPGTDLVRYGWDGAVARAFKPFSEDRIPARVARVDGESYLVATAGGADRCLPPQGGLDPGSESGPPATGDWVAIYPAPGSGLVLGAILPRRGTISRRASDGRRDQVLAANVDTILILHGLDRRPKLRRMERALVMAWDGGAVPLIVLTKADLAGGEHSGWEAEATRKEFEAIAPDVEVLVTSVLTGAGVGDVASRLQAGSTAALLGESGVGKSTLVNALAGEEIQSTGRLRWADSRGRHTTTARELVPLRSGAVLLDTPGLRTLGFGEAEQGGSEGMARTFGDVEALAAGCRFRDCGHDQEPDCGVQNAIAAGTLEPKRLAAYRKLQAEIDLLAKDVRERRAMFREQGRRYRRFKKGKEEW